MAKIRIGINGFGRIGRKVARLVYSPEYQNHFELAAINDLGDLKTIAHLLKYDSTHGIFEGSIGLEGSSLIINGQKIRFTSEKDPSKINWGKEGVSIVHECTGVFLEKEKAMAHVLGGAKKVILSAPAKDPDATLCMGVNEGTYDPGKHTIISNASCTTNCLAPLVKTLDLNFGIVRGLMTTIHSYTNDQNILDLPHKDLRRARAAALSQIPTSTGAAKAVGLVLPHLKGKLDGMAIRVPTPNVSLVDLTFETKKHTSKEAINEALTKASQNELRGILGVSHEPLVSIDYNGNTLSSIADLELTSVIEGNFCKAISWYDNESGFSARMLDLTRYMAQLL